MIDAIVALALAQTPVGTQALQSPAGGPAAISSAPAQSAVPEWIAAEGDDTTGAVLSYAGGMSLSILCRDDRIMFLIGGLTAAGSETRVLQLNAPGDALRNSTWIVGSDGTTAISTAPGFYARRLRTINQLTVRIPSAGNAAGRRYQFLLPETHEPLDTALQHCKEPLTRDSDLTFDPEMPVIVWERRPFPEFPTTTQWSDGSVALKCTAQPDGSVTDCEITTEDPRLAGFGPAALAAARNARLRQIDGAPITSPRDIRFTIRFHRQ